MRPVPGFFLWVGTARDARDLRGLHAAGVEAVVDLAAEEPPAVLSRDLVHLRLPLLDGGANPRWLLRTALLAVEELVGNGVPTLVACSAGMSRSPAVVAVVLAQLKGTQPADELAAFRPVDVSPGLWRTLLPAYDSTDRPATDEGTA